MQMGCSTGPLAAISPPLWGGEELTRFRKFTQRLQELSRQSVILWMRAKVPHIAYGVRLGGNGFESDHHDEAEDSDSGSSQAEPNFVAGTKKIKAFYQHHMT